MKHRDFDGSDAISEDSIADPEKYTDASNNAPSPYSTESDDGVAFTQEQISWFGMTPGFYRGSSRGSKSVTNV